MATTDRPKLLCQYWIEDEPVQCSHWNNAGSFCTFEKEETNADGTVFVRKADLYPTCNNIGTGKYRCKDYSGKGTKARCVIPDKSRTTSHSENCSFVTVTGTLDTTDGGPTHTPLIDYSKINQYNDGKCNSEAGAGTAGANPLCRGYSPHNMGFGRRAILCEDAIKTSYDPNDPTGSKTADIPLNSTSRLPMAYDIINARAKLGKCQWWDSQEIDFTLDEDGIVVPPTYNCIQGFFPEYFIDDDLGAFMPPCNGAKPECPSYTGNLVAPNGGKTFLSDRYLRSGDKIMAEQILEIRYNIFKTKWKPDTYKKSFTDPVIVSWDGQRPNVTYSGKSSYKYDMTAVKTEITDFDNFTITKTKTTLSSGNPTEDNRKNFPTLIRELKDVPIPPIILTEFENNVYETSVSDHKYLKIVGNCYSSNTSVFAINLSDPELNYRFIDIINNDNMLEVKINTGEERYEQLLDYLDNYYNFLLTNCQSKVFNNDIAGSTQSFSIQVDTFFGDNEIIVIDKSDNWSFDKIKVKKIFCGGLVAQIGFSVEKSGTTVSPENQESTITSASNNLNLKFAYKAFTTSYSGMSSSIDHFYIDSKIKKLISPFSLSTKTYYEVGAYLYKVSVIAAIDKMFFIGNDGTMLITLDDNKSLHCLIRSWELSDTTLKLTGVDVLNQPTTIDMVVDSYCTDDMMVNHVIIKPKDIDDYQKLYDYSLNIGLIYVYERHSFGETPSGPHIVVPYSTDPEVIYTVNNVVKSGGPTGDVTITSSPDMPLVVSAVFKGTINKRIVGQIKSDLIVWPKQVACSDVEIHYKWKANYTTTTLLPERYLDIQNLDVRFDGDTTWTYEPWCGDHYFGNSDNDTFRKPMWYPYTQCDDTSQYEIDLASGEYDTFAMEIFPQGGAGAHGYHDMRMLGPAQNIGLTTDVHFPIYNCAYDFTHTNYTINSDNLFDGWGRVRSNIDFEDMERITNNGGIGPKFGNPIRDYCNSYRSSAALYYYNITEGGDINVLKKWMPKNETFSMTSVDKSFQDYPFEYYFNVNDNLGTYLDQFGLLIASDSVDDINIGEYIVSGDDGFERYTFKDIFRRHYTTEPISYPSARVKHSVGTLEPTDIVPWHTYLEPSGSGAIQWAWQESNKDVERPTSGVDNMLSSFDPSFSPTYQSLPVDVLEFIQLYNPNSVWDYAAFEKHRVCDEGDHDIQWEVSNKLPPGTLGSEISSIYFMLRLDGGPAVIFDSTLTVVTNSALIPEAIEFSSLSSEEIIEHIAFYNICSQAPWLYQVNTALDLDTPSTDVSSDDVILYTQDTVVTIDEEEAEANATDDDRTVEYYNDGVKETAYYNRGLIARINGSNINYLPKEYVETEAPYEYKLSKKSDDNTDFSNIDTDLFYPSSIDFGMVYNSYSGSSVDLTFKIPALTIGKLDLVFNVGAIIPDEPEDVEGPAPPPSLYHFPEVQVSGSKDGLSYSLLGSYNFDAYSSNSGEVHFRNESIVFDLSLLLMDTKYNYLNLHMRYVPNLGELTLPEEQYYIHCMNLISITLNEVNFISATESVKTFERKYFISVGEYGDFPVHGYDDTGSLLYVDSYKLHTPDYIDQRSGMLGMSGTDTAFHIASKLRGRFVGDVKDDKIQLTGTYTEMEAEQAKIYDAVVESGSTIINFESVAHKVLRDDLLKVGVVGIPTWTCKFENKALRKLTPVEAKQPFNPAGHIWQFNPDTVSEEPLGCGPGGRKPATQSFKWMWSRMDGALSTDSSSALYMYCCKWQHSEVII